MANLWQSLHNVTAVADQSPRRLRRSRSARASASMCCGSTGTKAPPPVSSPSRSPPSGPVWPVCPKCSLPASTTTSAWPVLGASRGWGNLTSLFPLNRGGGLISVGMVIATSGRRSSCGCHPIHSLTLIDSSPRADERGLFHNQTCLPLPCWGMTRRVPQSYPPLRMPAVQLKYS